MKITVLVENSVHPDSGLIAEHGLAYWIETPNARILFDTGQSGDVLEHNARTLGIDLSSVSHIALSHGHYDHTGGLLTALKHAPHATVIAHPDALRSRYRFCDNHIVKDISMPLPVRERLQQHINLILTDQPYDIVPGIRLSGTIPMAIPFEPPPNDMFLDSEHCIPDLIPDDQAMILQPGQRSLILLGCAHRGLINTLLHIQNTCRINEFYAVIGGTHLKNASEQRINQTLDHLKKIAIRELSTGHCTGANAQNALKSAFPAITNNLRTGQSWT